MPTALLAPALSLLLLAGTPAPTPAPVPAEDFTTAALAHPITLKKVEAFAAAVKELRAAAAKDPSIARRFQANEKVSSLAEATAKVEGMPKVKAILDRHGVTGRDFVLTPIVVLSARAMLMAEQSGHPAPAEHQNQAAVALLRAEGPRVEKLAEGFMNDLRAIGGK